jgi:adenylate cyclase
MGTVGYTERMETTILGTVVNIAAKIEKLNKKYNTAVILTEEACKAADHKRFTFRLLEEAFIPGIAAPVKLYTIDHNSMPKAIDAGETI